MNRIFLYLTCLTMLSAQGGQEQPDENECKLMLEAYHNDPSDNGKSPIDDLKRIPEESKYYDEAINIRAGIERAEQEFETAEQERLTTILMGAYKREKKRLKKEKKAREKQSSQCCIL